ncbi:cytochrome-c peroxidase [Sphingobium yanoikuyae]|uniref:cytochrome-c peroxidase n=1 Tax=Sphingobium yanoikuyae TaxID=13690 RepID=UPI0007A7640C|nr:cytochrome-c peroxidase [Sphingobium yanoikuyae]KZC80222.1 cytochrome-c peroxidase [Sphingobium yanoikuyae]
MRVGGAAIIGAAALLATGLGAARPAWRWPALPSGVAAPAIPSDNGMTAAKVALGRRLFYDRALSADGSMACADCHQQEKGFTDGLATHQGVMGEMGVRNVPGLANVAWRSGLTWTEAGLSTLEQQAMVPMTGTKPVEMGLAQDDVGLARRIGADPCYRRMFAAAFPDAPNDLDFARVTAALAAFQRTMTSFGSAHDRGTLSPLAQRGARQFAAAGCGSCHSGPDFTDSKTHYVGTAAPQEVDAAAYGGKPLPLGFEPPPEQFRTPSLRNVAVTGPWLHDGQSPTIEAAIRRHAAPMLVDVDMPALLAFLDALTDHDFLKNAALARPAATCPIPA